MRTSLERVLTDGLAAFAVARTITAESVSGPAMNHLLLRLVHPTVPDAVFATLPEPARGTARGHAARQLDDDVRTGRADLRALHRDGWTDTSGWRAWAADLLTCPVCLSFHTAWVTAAATDRRPWRPGWWVRVFAVWAVAAQLARAAWNPSPSEAGTRITAAFTAATGGQ